MNRRHNVTINTRFFPWVVSGLGVTTVAVAVVIGQDALADFNAGAPSAIHNAVPESPNKSAPST